MLVHLGHIDLAYGATARAVAAAERSYDELRHAAITGWMSWLLLHQTGCADGVQDTTQRGRPSPLTQARRLAVEQADRIEPKLGKATPSTSRSGAGSWSTRPWPPPGTARPARPTTS
jgi:hypothetical protein